MNHKHSKSQSLEKSKAHSFKNDRHSSKGHGYNLLSRDRLNFPMNGKGGRYLQSLSEEQSQRLISPISSDEDSPCDIYSTGFLSDLAGDEIVEFLRRDGFDLVSQPTTTEPEYPDLDLVPPHAVTKRRSFCSRLLCCDKCKTSCNTM